MPGLDTNVLVRWLTRDDPVQVEAVRRVFAAAAGQPGAFFVPHTVVLEVEWVLRARYGFDRTQLLGVFSALLETQELAFEAESALEHALHLFREHSADFADCLHAGHCSAAGVTPLLTFDRRAMRLPGVRGVD